MSTTKGIKASVLAANLIEAQIKTLPLTLAALTKAFEAGGVEQAYFDRIFHHRKLKLVDTASGGNIVAEKVENPDKHPEGPLIPLAQRYDKQTCVHLIVGNSLVMVGAFMKAHGMLDMRTPEFQFLGHVVDAILNGYTLTIPPGYMPVASFDGLVIDSRTDGMPLFSTEAGAGFLEVGDALALLDWLTLYLRGERSFVSGGDAG
jgi:hypothetical protein